MSNNKIGIIMTNNNIYELLSTSDTIILDYTKYKWSINKDNNVLTLIEVIKQENDNHSIINTFLKKIDLTYADKIFHQNNQKLTPYPVIFHSPSPPELSPPHSHENDWIV